MKSKEIPRCTDEEPAGRDNGGAAGCSQWLGDGFRTMAGRLGMLPSTGWEKPQPVPTLLFGTMASYVSDETVLGPNVYKVLPNPCWPCGGLLQCHPGGQGEGGKALWPQRGPGQLECEGNGA